MKRRIDRVRAECTDRHFYFAIELIARQRLADTENEIQGLGVYQWVCTCHRIHRDAEKLDCGVHSRTSSAKHQSCAKANRGDCHPSRLAYNRYVTPSHSHTQYFDVVTADGYHGSTVLRGAMFQRPTGPHPGWYTQP